MDIQYNVIHRIIIKILLFQDVFHVVTQAWLASWMGVPRSSFLGRPCLLILQAHHECFSSAGCCVGPVALFVKKCYMQIQNGKVKHWEDTSHRPIKSCILQSAQLLNHWLNSQHEKLKPKMNTKFKMFLSSKKKHKISYVLMEV